MKKFALPLAAVLVALLASQSEAAPRGRGFGFGAPGPGVRPGAPAARHVGNGFGFNNNAAAIAAANHRAAIAAANARAFHHVPNAGFGFNYSNAAAIAAANARAAAAFRNNAFYGQAYAPTYVPTYVPRATVFVDAFGNPIGAAAAPCGNQTQSYQSYSFGFGY